MLKISAKAEQLVALIVKGLKAMEIKKAGKISFNRIILKTRLFRTFLGLVTADPDILLGAVHPPPKAVADSLLV